MRTSVSHRSWIAPAALALALVTAACAKAPGAANTSTTGSGAGSSTTSGGTPASAPGVTATAINVGAITTRTGALAGLFAGLVPGALAYFKLVNSQGGIDGRQIVLKWNLDDGGQISQFGQDATTLINQDHAFAALVSSPWFSPNAFVSAKIPTYGYNVSANWSPWPNLFAVGGSVQSYTAGVPVLAWFVKKLHINNVAFISYGREIASSYDACTAYSSLMSKNGYHVVLTDVSANLNNIYTSDVQRMRSANANLVVSCMQASDNVTLARNLQQYGMSNVKQLWLNGYDQNLLNQNQSVMNHVYLANTGSVPFGAATDTAKYGNTYAGMQQYIATMNKYEKNYTYDDIAFQGWQSAALLVQGIRLAGKDLTQANVIAQTNNITDFTANGLSAPVDWKTAHTQALPPNCNAFLQVQGDQFVSVLAAGKQVFVCVNGSVRNPQLVTPPPGTPGT
jgi:branched-chain amino acid transport system substrate-binding protein